MLYLYIYIRDSIATPEKRPKSVSKMIWMTLFAAGAAVKSDCSWTLGALEAAKTNRG